MKNFLTGTVTFLLISIFSVNLFADPMKITPSGITFPDSSIQTTAIAGSWIEDRKIQSLPHTISDPGFYYIAENLSSTGDGIIINSDNVTIDLMGFTINGPETGGHGVYFESRSNIEIRNGNIQDFSYGIWGQTDAQSIKIIDIKTISNAGYGILIAGGNHTVRNCTVIDSGAYGIYVPDDGGHIIRGNIVSGSLYYGITAGRGSVVTGNTSYGNTQHGINLKGGGCTAISNSVHGNKFAGILIDSDGNTVLNNTAYSNNQNLDESRGGIAVLGNNNLIKGNTVTDNSLNNICIKGTYNSIENNLVTGSTDGIDFKETGNFYDYNRAANNTNNYYNDSGNTDGGNNVSF